MDCTEPALDVAVFDAPWVEYIGLVVDERLVEMFGFRCFLALDPLGLFLHARHLPAGFAQEFAGMADRIFGQPRHLVAEHESAAEFLEVRGIGQRNGFEHEDPQVGGVLGDGKLAGTGRCRVSRPCEDGQTTTVRRLGVAVN